MFSKSMLHLLCTFLFFVSSASLLLTFNVLLMMLRSDAFLPASQRHLAKAVSKAMWHLWCWCPSVYLETFSENLLFSLFF